MRHLYGMNIELYEFTSEQSFGQALGTAGKWLRGQEAAGTVDGGSLSSVSLALLDEGSDLVYCVYLYVHHVQPTGNLV